MEKPEPPFPVPAGNQMPDHECGQQRSDHVTALQHHASEPVKVFRSGPASAVPDLGRTTFAGNVPE